MSPEPTKSEPRGLNIREEVLRIDRQMADIHRMAQAPLVPWKLFVALAAGAAGCMVAGAVMAMVL